MDVTTILALLDKASTKAPLSQIGLSPERVRALTAASKPFGPDEVRRAVVRSLGKGRTGRGGLPESAVATMHRDYLRLRSLAETGALYGRTRQAMYEIFKTHGMPLIARKFYRRVSYDGLFFTPGKDGLLRCTQGKRQLLHHLIWEKENGEIPIGHQVVFRDGNPDNLGPNNLVCMSTGDIARANATGHNQSTPKSARRSITGVVRTGTRIIPGTLRVA